MIRNYLLTALRHSRNHSIYILSNVLGLALGLACCIVAFFNWQFHTDFDGLHAQGDNIYKVNSIRKISGELHKYGTSPAPLAQFLTEHSSAVELSSRYWSSQNTFRLGEKVLRRNIAFVDPGFVSMFSFELIGGTYNIENSGIVITESTASEFFEDTPPLGKSITLLVTGQTYELQVAGIIADHPLNSSFKFQALLSSDLYSLLNGSVDEDWSISTHATFLLGRELNNELISEQINKYTVNVNEVVEEWTIEELFLTPLSEMANEARYMRGNYLGQNNPEGAIMIPTLMALMILLVACFNFTNTSIALAGKRVKEIAVRKAIGGRRSQIAGQLLFECLATLALSLILGIIFAEILLPLYNGLGPWIDIEVSYVGNLGFWAFLIGILFASALLGGLYPALYVSRFSTHEILKKKVKLRGSNLFTKTLLILQLCFSTMVLVQGVLYLQTTAIQKEFDLGFDRDNVITIALEGNGSLQGLMDNLEQYPQTRHIAASRHHLGFALARATLKLPDEEIQVRWLEVGENYSAVIELQLIDGRDFEKNTADLHNSILVNEAFTKSYQLQLGDPVAINDNEYQIIGVVEDFYPDGLWRGEQRRPTVLKLSSNKYNYLVVNVNGDKTVADNHIRQVWPQYFPESPYESQLDNEQVYLSELLSENMSYFSFFQAIVAVLLSVNALFTMISINITNRIKEIGVRKVLGASIAQIANLFNKSVIVILAISLSLGIVSGHYLSELFLDLMFSVHAHLNVATALSATGMLLSVAYATIGLRIFRAANNNPVDALRYE